ncbi:MAG: hypothetical protein ACF8XB_00460 [Planctomycetota bacterium JB042]
MKNVDPAKVVIWTLLLLAAAGVGTHFWLKDKLDQASKDVKLSLQGLRQVAEAKSEIDALRTEIERNDYVNAKAENKLLTFFEKMATNAGLPRPSVDAPRDDTPRSGKQKGFEDTSYELTWQKSGRQRPRFDRERAAKFAWWIENESQLLKVTSIKLTTDPRQFDDLWEYRLWVTERRPTSSAGS